MQCLTYKSKTWSNITYNVIMKVICLLDALPLLQGNTGWLKGTVFYINGYNRPKCGNAKLINGTNSSL